MMSEPMALIKLRLKHGYKKSHGRLLNKRGTTWRKLEDPRKDNINKTNAIELMLENPTLIKRPVVTVNDDCMVGFKEADYTTYFGK